MRSYLLLPVILSTVFSYHFKYKKNVMFTIRPGETTCFLKKVSRHSIIKVEYQVLDLGGRRSNQSISFDLIAPRMRRAAASQRWPAGAHVIDAALPGVYRFCFDNSFDDKNKKSIFLNLTIRNKKKKLRRKIKTLKYKNNRRVIKRLTKKRKEKKTLTWVMNERDGKNKMTSRRKKKTSKSPNKTKPKSLWLTNAKDNRDKLIWFAVENKQLKSSLPPTTETSLKYTMVWPDGENENDKLTTEPVTENIISYLFAHTTSYEKNNLTRSFLDNSQTKTTVQPSDEVQPTEETDQRMTVKQNGWLAGKRMAVKQKMQKNIFSQNTKTKSRKNSPRRLKEDNIFLKPVKDNKLMQIIKQTDLDDSNILDDDDDEDEELLEDENMVRKHKTELPIVKQTTTTLPLDMDINNILNQFDLPAVNQEQPDLSESITEGSRSTVWLPYRWDMID